MKNTFIYPQYITWKIDISAKKNALFCFPEKTAKKIQKSQERLNQAGYQFVFEPVDMKYMDKFTPLYVDNVSTKTNPKVFDVKTEIEKRIFQGIVLEALSLYKENKYLGGCIYMIYPERISYIYRTFTKIFDLSLPINAAMVADYLVYQRAIDYDKHMIFHGRDRNLYGLHSDIGVAEFKLHSGCAPYVSKHENQTFFSRTVGDDFGTQIQTIEGTHFILEQNFNKSKEAVLIFLGEKSEEKIKNALLFVKNKNEELLKKYNYLFKNPNFTTEVIEIEKIP